MTTRIGPYPINSVIHGHALELVRQLPDNSVHVAITSSPYWGLRFYGTPPAYWPEITFQPIAGLPSLIIPEWSGELGQEPEPWSFVGHLVAVFREVRRVLHPMGSLWMNLGDSYARDAGMGEKNRGGRLGADLRGSREGCPKMDIPAGLKPKDLVGIPWMVAKALQADGWYLRSDIPWIKRNGIPGSQQDRPTTSKEYWFLLSKCERYYFDQESIKMAPADYTRKGGKAPYTANGSASHGIGSNSLHQMSESGRYRRDSDWFFDSLRAILNDNAQILLTDEEGELLALTVNPKPYSKAHFATFSPELVTPMVLCSTSEYGHCSACGNPWVRVVERKAESQEKPKKVTKNGVMLPDKARIRHGLGKSTLSNTDSIEKVTTGWQPTCNCAAEVVPAVVLDPFFGSGSTGTAAAKNRRHYLGFELNEDYLGLAPERVTTQVKMF